jgi:hypothetical protein
MQGDHVIYGQVLNAPSESRLTEGGSTSKVSLCLQQ